MHLEPAPVLPCIQRPVRGGGVGILPYRLRTGVEKPEWFGYAKVKKSLICLAVSTQYRCVTDRQTDRRDGQTDISREHSKSEDAVRDNRSLVHITFYVPILMDVSD